MFTAEYVTAAAADGKCASSVMNPKDEMVAIELPQAQPDAM
jgi:hypothetical protein